MGYFRRLLVEQGGASYRGGAAFSPISLSPHTWLRFSDYGLADDDPIATATDLSGNGNHWTQATGANQPTFKTSIVNGRGVARFDGTSDFLSGPDLSGLTASEIFIVLRLDADPPPSNERSGLWDFGSSADVALFPFPFDSLIYDDFGTTARKTTVDPTPSLAAAFRLYNVVSVAGEWTSFLDGTQLFTTGTNTVGFTATPTLGRSDATFHFDGDMAELILLDRKLDPDEKAATKGYIASRYALTIA